MWSKYGYVGPTAELVNSVSHPFDAGTVGSRCKMWSSLHSGVLRLNRHRPAAPRPGPPAAVVGGSMDTCSAEWCDRPAKTCGLCGRCYQRELNDNPPIGPPEPPPVFVRERRPVADRTFRLEQRGPWVRVYRTNDGPQLPDDTSRNFLGWRVWHGYELLSPWADLQVEGRTRTTAMFRRNAMDWTDL